MNIPEEGMKLMVQLHCFQAEKQVTKSFEIIPASDFVSDEVLVLGRLAVEEANLAAKLERYSISTQSCYNTLYQDREMYHFLGLLYASRLFQDPEQRSAFLKGTQDVSEKDLMAVVSCGRLVEASSTLLSSPQLISVIEKIVRTDFFTHRRDKYTLENERLSPVLQHLRARKKELHAMRNDDKVEPAGLRVVLSHFKRLEKEIVSIYKLADLGPKRQKGCSEDQAFSLSDKDAEKLLCACRRNKFFYDLITKMPPNCLWLSHEQALLECAEHARLWLFNAKIPVYYNFELQYSELAKADTATHVELSAWRSEVGYGARLPSSEEKEVRRLTLATYWRFGAAKVDFLVPDDFDNKTDHPDANLIKFLGRAFVRPERDACVSEALRNMKTQLDNISAIDLPRKFAAFVQMARSRSNKMPTELGASSKLPTKRKRRRRKDGQPLLGLQ